MAVMAELAWRGYNVALPEIDKGDDVFAIGARDALFRVQVKTASGKVGRRRVTYQFRLRVRQLADPGIIFVFAMRRPGKWHFWAVKGPELAAQCRKGLGSPNRSFRVITISCSKVSGKAWMGGGRSIDKLIDHWIPLRALREEAT